MTDNARDACVACGEECNCAELGVGLLGAVLGKRIVAALESAWDDRCAGNKNPIACESCRAYEDAICITRGVIARV